METGCRIGGPEKGRYPARFVPAATRGSSRVHSSPRPAPGLAGRTPTWFGESDLVGEHTEKELTVRVEEINDLFISSEPRPFSEEPNYWPVLEHIFRTIRPRSVDRPTLLKVLVTDEPSTPGLETETKAAIRRRSDVRIDGERSEIAFHRKEGISKLMLGLCFLAVCLVLNEAAMNADFLPNFLQDYLATGIEILGWVALWSPVGILIYEWWPHRHNIAVYEHIANMDVELVRARRATP